MAFSEDGRLWVTVFRQGDITVLDPDGSFDRRIKLPGNSPTNVAFGPRGDTRIYITEGDTGTLESRDVGVGGLAAALLGPSDGRSNSARRSAGRARAPRGGARCTRARTGSGG